MAIGWLCKHKRDLMKIAHIFTLALASTTLSGCALFQLPFSIPSHASYQQLHGTKAKPADLKGCGYTQFNQTEYQLAPNDRQAELAGIVQPYQKSYRAIIQPSSSIRHERFKILQTDLPYRGDASETEPLLLAGIAFNKRNAFTTSVVTQSCEIYYLRALKTPKEAAQHYVRVDEKPFGLADYKKMNGPFTLYENVFTTHTYEDQYDKAINIRTSSFNGALIRGSLNSATKAEDYTQLYISTLFHRDWGHLKHAKDSNGNAFHVRRIDSEADCSKSISWCELTETVGVDISLAYLHAHQDGFKLKVYGAKTKYFDVPAKMVKAYLDEVHK